MAYGGYFDAYPITPSTAASTVTSLVQPWYPTPLADGPYCPHCGAFKGFRPAYTNTYTIDTTTGTFDPDLDVTALDLLQEPEAMRSEEV